MASTAAPIPGGTSSARGRRSRAAAAPAPIAGRTRPPTRATTARITRRPTRNGRPHDAGPPPRGPAALCPKFLMGPGSPCQPPWPASAPICAPSPPGGSAGHPLPPLPRPRRCLLAPPPPLPSLPPPPGAPPSLPPADPTPTLPTAHTDAHTARTPSSPATQHHHQPPNPPNPTTHQHHLYLLLTGSSHQAATPAPTPTPSSASVSPLGIRTHQPLTATTISTCSLYLHLISPLAVIFLRERN